MLERTCKRHASTLPNLSLFHSISLSGADCPNEPGSRWVICAYTSQGMWRAVRIKMQCSPTSSQDSHPTVTRILHWHRYTASYTGRMCSAHRSGLSTKISWAIFVVGQTCAGTSIAHFNKWQVCRGNICYVHTFNHGFIEYASLLNWVSIAGPLPHAHAELVRNPAGSTPAAACFRIFACHATVGPNHGRRF